MARQLNKILFLTITLFFFKVEANCQLTAAQNYARNRPGVVMVRTNFSATMYMKQVVIENRPLNSLLDSIDRIIYEGTQLSSEDKLDILLSRFSNQPSKYFRSTADYRRHSQSITTTGTGFFITEDGYVVTNCHVVDESDDHIRKKFILSAFRQVTETNIKALQNSWAVTFNDPQKELLYNTFAKVYSSLQSILLENLQKNIYVLYGSDTANNQSSVRSETAKLILKGQSMPGKDVAILKIETEQPLPVVRLAGNALPRIGDRIYVFGFPDPVTRNEYLAVESTLDPSLTTGIVSGIRTTTNGWNVVQMDAAINHGNSGGPVCNEKGEVIGIATFGSIEFRTGVLAAGMNFSIPVSILQDFLRAARIESKPGEISLLYESAMKQYDKEEYRAALKNLKSIHKIDPSFPGLSNYINDCSVKIGNGYDKTEQKLKLWLLVAGLFVLMMIFLWFRRSVIQKKVFRSSINMRSQEDKYLVKRIRER